MSHALSPANGSTDRFGYEWQKYNEMLPIYEEQFLRWTCLLPKSEWQNKSFLDVGCGMGRNSFWPLKYGAKSCVAVDVDERSLASAQTTLAPFSQTSEVKKCSAYDMTFKDQFDIAFSIGVIHHLEHPHVALSKMAEAVKPGGKVVIWVYGNQNVNMLIQFLNPLRKILFSRLPVEMTHILSWCPTALLWLFLRMGLGRIEYFKLLRKFTFPHLRSIVFDQMLPTIAHYWTKEEVFSLMTVVGLKNVRIQEVNQISWCAVGQKF